MAQERLIVDFWDVGQGDCSVIRLPDDSLIIIDVGPKTTPLVDWLNEKPRRIHAVVITHNDADHAGGLPSLVKAAGLSIGTVYMLCDRGKDDQRFLSIFEPVRVEERKGRFRVLGLDETRQIWENASRSLEMKAIFPTFSANIEAAKPNETSAVVCLRQGADEIIVWPGDAPMQVVADKCRGWTPVVMSGPHHGGPVDRSKPGFNSWVEGVKPERLFVSVGTTNNYGLPTAAYLLQRAKHGCLVLCSQLTKLCDNRHVNEDKPILQTAGLLGLRPPRSGVSCRGCFRLVVTETSVVPDPYDAVHRERVSRLKRPKCLESRNDGTQAIAPLPTRKGKRGNPNE